MKKLKSALKKKALGYTVEETVEEYGTTEEGFSLTKKKVTKKHVPPDLQAIKAMLELEDGDGELERLTEEELIQERERLIAELNKTSNKERKDGSKEDRGQEDKV